jgi:hypothetical protein
MFFMKKILLFLCLAVLMGHVAGLEIPAGTPVFAKPDPRTQPIATVMEAFDAQVVDREMFFLPYDFMVRRMMFYKIHIGDDKTAFVSPEIRCEQAEDGKWSMAFRPDTGFKIGDMFLLGCLMVLSAVFMFAARAKLRRNGGEGADWYCAWLPGLCKSLVLLTVLMAAGGIYLFSTDEPDFFVTGADLAAGTLAHFQPRSLGTGIWYAPFVALFHADDVYEILVPVSYMTAFVLSPLAFALFYSFLRRFMTRWCAMTAVMTAAVAPLFFFRAEVFQKGLVQCFFQPSEIVPGFRLYQTMIWGGFNAMSDTPAMLCLFAGLAAAVRFVRPRTAMMWSAGWLAGAMLFRVNAALFLPAFILLWLPLRPSRKDWLWAAAVGGIVFLPQLIVNTIQLGAPWIFPYVRYENTADGFMFSMFPANAKLLFGANAPFFWAGLGGLLLMKRSLFRQFLVLWIVPTTVFFLGYYHYRDDAVRFLLPLFAPLCAAAAAGFYDAFGRDYVKIVLVGAVIFFTAPAVPWGAAFGECWNLPAGTSVFVVCGCLLVAVFDAWRSGKWQLVPWVALYLWGGVWGAVALLTASVITSFPWRRMRKTPQDASTTVDA